MPHATVASRAPRVHYPTPYRVSVVAKALGCTRSTAKAWLTLTHPSCPITRTAHMRQALLEAGLGREAEAILQVVQRVGVFADPDLFEQLEQEEQEIDGREDVAQVAFLQDPTAAHWQTRRRIIIENINRLARLLNAGDARFGVLA